MITPIMHGCPDRLQADGLHVSCDTSNQVELIAKESGALVTLATDIEDKGIGCL